ncbi:MAG: hypothetical protein AB7N73_14970 [Gemmatimonadales bacterium]
MSEFIQGAADELLEAIGADPDAPALAPAPAPTFSVPARAGFGVGGALLLGGLVLGAVHLLRRRR